ncbi:MAG TPA: DUF3300 domain-containing protein [Rhodopila sp.]
MKRSKQSFAFLVFGALVLGVAPGGHAAEVGPPDAPPAEPATPAPPATSPPVLPAVQTPGQPSGALDQLVAPIALYPDALIAQILAAAMSPTEIVEADRWMQQGASLDQAQFGASVDQQPWDDSVKALTQFPAVLANMDQNLGWTAALGQAYASQPQAVFDAIQVMRRRAEQAGTLQSSSQETVTTEGQTIDIEPASPDFVYVPEYDPWIAYGAPLDAYPAWDPYPGLFLDGPGYWFDPGVAIGIFGGFAWGWHHWGADWHGRRLVYNHGPYIAHHGTFADGHDRYFGSRGFAPVGAFRAGAPFARLGSHPGGVSGFAHASGERLDGFRGGVGYAARAVGGEGRGGGEGHGGGGRR